MIIAIDGPAASGKGTLSRLVASHYGLRHLDTGLTYRAVARAMLERGGDLENADEAEDAALSLDLSAMDRRQLSAHEVGEAASKVAVMPAVRKALVLKQRRFAASPPGAVLDGRDIGTVVCPDADVKLFVFASSQTRARRRYHEILSRGGVAEEAAILADIERRDARDAGRADSPLRPAEDAVLLDTTHMDIDDAFEAARKLIDETVGAA